MRHTFLELQLDPLLDSCDRGPGVVCGDHRLLLLDEREAAKKGDPHDEVGWLDDGADPVDAISTTSWPNGTATAVDS